MTKALLIIYEPALFLLAALGCAGWELWSMRARTGDKPKAAGTRPLDRSASDVGTSPDLPTN